MSRRQGCRATLAEAKGLDKICFARRNARETDSDPRDVVAFDRGGKGGDVVLQCKFTEDLLGAKAKNAASLDALRKNGRRTTRWVLCVPVDLSGIFMNWLQNELEERRIAGEVWGRSELLARLEQHRDVLQTFFYSVHAELASLFRTEHLELFQLMLDPTSRWRQQDAKVLGFSRRGDVRSPDLVFDVIVRNTGTVGTALTGIEAEDVQWAIREAVWQRQDAAMWAQ